jgi:hypothetical protein
MAAMRYSVEGPGAACACAVTIEMVSDMLYDPPQAAKISWRKEATARLQISEAQCRELLHGQQHMPT